MALEAPLFQGGQYILFRKLVFLGDQDSTSGNASATIQTRREI
jgi:hypothetical protein